MLPARNERRIRLAIAVAQTQSANLIAQLYGASKKPAEIHNNQTQLGLPMAASVPENLQRPTDSYMNN
jgi:hypothetical protein